MGVTFKNTILKNGQVHGVMNKIATFSGFNPWILPKFAKMVASFKAINEKTQKHYIEQVKMYAVLNEAGEIQIDKDGAPVIKEGSEEGWKAFSDSFDEQTFELDVEPFSLSHLEKVGISPTEYLAIEPLFIKEDGDEKSNEKSEAGQKTEKVVPIR